MQQNKEPIVTYTRQEKSARLGAKNEPVLLLMEAVIAQASADYIKAIRAIEQNGPYPSSRSCGRNGLTEPEMEKRMIESFFRSLSPELYPRIIKHLRKEANSEL